VNNTELKCSSKEEGLYVEGWEQVDVCWCIESGRGLLCSMKLFNGASRACSVRIRLDSLTWYPGPSTPVSSPTSVSLHSALCSSDFVKNIVGFPSSYILWSLFPSAFTFCRWWVYSLRFALQGKDLSASFFWPHLLTFPLWNAKKQRICKAALSLLCAITH